MGKIDITCVQIIGEVEREQKKKQKWESDAFAQGCPF